MSRYIPKFELGDVVQVVSKKSKHNGMFGVFKGYTNGLNEHMCRVQIGYDIIFLMETSIKLITEKNIADLHYAEARKSIREEMMQSESNINVKYEGKHIRIGVHKVNGNTYMQKVGKDAITNLWFRFEPEYYLDYEEYIKEYCDYLKQETNYPSLSYCTILDGEAVEHYINIFNATSVYVNNECIYNKDGDVSYTLEQYKEDMKKLDTLNFYPFIEHVDIDVIDYVYHELRFKTNIKHKKD